MSTHPYWKALPLTLLSSPETVRVQGPGVHKALHGPELAEEAREDSARGGLLRAGWSQEAQGQRARRDGGEALGHDGGRLPSQHESHDSEQQRERESQNKNRGAHCNNTSWPLGQHRQTNTRTSVWTNMRLATNKCVSAASVAGELLGPLKPRHVPGWHGSLPRPRQLADQRQQCQHHQRCLGHWRLGAARRGG